MLGVQPTAQLGNAQKQRHTGRIGSAHVSHGARANQRSAMRLGLGQRICEHRLTRTLTGGDAQPAWDVGGQESGRGSPKMLQHSAGCRERRCDKGPHMFPSPTKRFALHILDTFLHLDKARVRSRFLCRVHTLSLSICHCIPHLS